jgi:hypothetical protein
MREGTYLIVSLLVKNAVNRPDFLVPTEIVRDKNGKAIGFRSLGL